MTAERLRQLRNLLQAALEREAALRPAFIAEACRNDPELQEELRRLLEADDTTVTMLEFLSPQPTRTEPASREGHRLGDYEIIRLLGRGGMGSVYLARRADESFHKKVAIKILHPDAATSDMLRRFQQEREILAHLDHPNIARLLDAGSTEDGLPYFVMEYAQGRHITEYADDQRLSIRERITLFRQACDAVHYAHQHNIVHRDLKPGNMLVTAEGQVKLLDFGIARQEQDTKAIALTRTGTLLMTPEYASPEQLRGEVIGRASDIYSLAVVLFELLTGHRPYHLDRRIFHEVVRVVCEEPPKQPSIIVAQAVEVTTEAGQVATLPPESAARLRQTSLDDLKQQLSGDLDNILLMALQKRPQDRYASVFQLRSDLDRHLGGEPVWARRDSRLYRASRQFSRYRIAFIVLAALIAAVATGSVTLHWSTLAWAVGAAALTGLWQAASDPQIGQRLAQPWIPGVLVAAPIIALAIKTIYTSDAWLNAIAVHPLFLPVAASILLGWWPLLRHRAGPLVLKLGTSRKGWISALVCISILAPAWTLKLLRDGHVTYKDLALTACFVPYGIFVHRYSAIGEIRIEGFIVRAGLIRWRRIASWTWADNRSQKVLVLNLRRRIHFLPPVRIQVRTSQQDQVEAILARQFGEWPPGNGERAR